MRTLLLIILFFAASPALAEDVEIIREKEQSRYHKGGTEVRMLVEKSGGAYLGRLNFEPNTKVPAHRHKDSDEMLTILTGEGTMHIGGKPLTVKAGDAVYIPKNTEHDFVAGSKSVTAIQVYTPAGPESRFREWDKQDSSSR